jgi:rubrerythrin
MALFWLLQKGYRNIKVYGMDFFKTGYFDNRKITNEKESIIHNNKIEEDYVLNKMKGDFIMANRKSAKKISNKAIQEPVEFKQVEVVEKKKELIRCKSCQTMMEYGGVPRGCPNCNTVNGK